MRLACLHPAALRAGCCLLRRIPFQQVEAIDLGNSAALDPLLGSQSQRLTDMRGPSQVLLPQVGAGSLVQFIPQQSLETRLKLVPAKTSVLSSLPLLYPASLTPLLLCLQIISGQALPLGNTSYDSSHL